MLLHRGVEPLVHRSTENLFTLRGNGGLTFSLSLLESTRYEESKNFAPKMNKISRFRSDRRIEGRNRPILCSSLSHSDGIDGRSLFLLSCFESTTGLESIRQEGD